MASKRILSIGQCAADHYGIGSFVQTHFDDVAVDEANTAVQAMAAMSKQRYDLVLVNRVFDYDGTSGPDFIRRLKADEALAAVPVMLVSNHADAQHEAQLAGAVRGFGKAKMGEAARETIRAALGD